MAAQAKPFGLSIDLSGFQKVKDNVDGWVKSQGIGAEVAAHTLFGAVQGAFFGSLMGGMAALDPSMAPSPPGGGPSMLTMGGPLQQAKAFAVMTGVNAGLSRAIKHHRGGVEDWKGAMGAAFGSGMCFSFVSGMAPQGNPAAAAIATGVSFAIIQGMFSKVGEVFTRGMKQEDPHYVRAKNLLKMLNLSQYERNIQKGMLADNTIMLWNDAALQEVRIPPGPRLLILHHLDQYRHLLKPAVPLPGALPPPQPTYK